jgi:hypothetical protein
MEKLLTIHSCSRLPKDGDGIKYLIEYSITKLTDKIKEVNSSENSTIVVSISRSLIRNWQSSGRIKLNGDIYKELLRYGISELKTRIKNFQKILPNEEFSLTTYNDYSPTIDDNFNINLEYSEIIEVKGKMGFLPNEP